VALDRELVATIDGTPAGKGSMKCVTPHLPGRRAVLVEQLKATTPWREKIAAATSQLLTRTAEEYQPIGVEVTFVFDRPSSHYTAGDRTRLKPSSPRYPTNRTGGDVDKLCRTVLDALQDGPRPILDDDAQVVELVARKRYADCLSPDVDPRPDHLTWDAMDHPGIVLRIYPIT
jgi:Holliday junction resolvase RusA-like endonuclease